MRHVTTLALAALLAAGTAHAAVVSYSAPAFTDGDFSQPNAVQAFDPALGTLNSALLQFTGTIAGGASSDGTLSRPPLVTITPSLLVGLVESFQLDFSPVVVAPTYPPGGGYDLSFSVTGTVSLQLAGDAVYPFRDPSGAVGYTLAAGYVMAPNPNAEYQTWAPFYGTATVTYDFTPFAVPEPASLALLGFGIAGAAGLRRRGAGPGGGA